MLNASLPTLRAKVFHRKIPRRVEIARSLYKQLLRSPAQKQGGPRRMENPWHVRDGKGGGCFREGNATPFGLAGSAKITSLGMVLARGASVPLFWALSVTSANGKRSGDCRSGWPK